MKSRGASAVNITPMETPMKLTPRDKDAIRNSRCGKCHKRPPFADGSRCHPHRLVPAKGYVKGNVVPRCPKCHSQEPGHNPQFTLSARKAGLKGGRKGGQKGGLASQAKRSPAQRREF